ncbi:sedolisin [Reticulibacter mediterranei]|uniref:Sedolisin n=2 Tax=Reticulibacter mediterranei TaxID=2778369 RepID=A0A8J3N5E0_9CHLR|nr:sedolisin [Reticulibacter mediterranei]
MQFTTLNLGLPQKALSAPITGIVSDDQMLHVNVTLKVDQATLNQLGESNGQSSSTGSTPDLAKKLGISDENLKTIQEYFDSNNIKITPNKTRTNLTFDAKASSVAHLLQTRFVIHRLNGRTFFTPDPKQMPKVPASIAGYILAVTGLDNYSAPPTHKAALATQPLTGGLTHHQSDAGCVNFYPSVAAPDRLAHAYGYDRLWASGWHGENMTVNLIEMDGFSTSDLSNYFACTGSHAKLDYVNLGSSAPPVGIEALIDIEMLAGLAPNVHLIDYQMDPALLNGSGSNWWTAFNNALQQIVDDNQNIPHPGSTLSISLGGAEDDLSQDTLLAVDQNLQILTKAEHMTVFVASGDCGAYASGIYKGTPDTSFPASDPWSAAVGGTRITLSNNNTRANEVVWQQDLSNLSQCQNKWGSGGGLSGFFARPAFQQGPGVANKYSTGKRQVPDIAAAATNLPLYYQGQWITAYGTSAAAPIWAAGLALANEGLMLKKHIYFYGPTIFYYAANHPGNLQPFYNVTSGNNLYYDAAPGWNYTSGLGTPNLMDFFNVLYNAQ